MQHILNINGTPITVSAGETLVDAALGNRILIPHDCASGQCETCRVRVAWGNVDDAGTAYGDTVLACQARVQGDATITFEEVPATETVSARVETLTELSSSVVELTLRCNAVLPFRPGQYARLQLADYPARDYSFSAKMDGSSQPDQIIFQIRRLSGGAVSSALGRSVTPGHKAKLTGPFGNAYLRKQETGPIVLSSSGTGFAPIWSLARSVTLANDNRPLTIITGIRSAQDCYMDNALGWLRDHGQNRQIVVAREAAASTMRCGTVDQHLPALDNNTTVHVAGNVATVEKVKAKARLANAYCYCDPFTPAHDRLSWRHKLARAASLSSLFSTRNRQSA